MSIKSWLVLQVAKTVKKKINIWADEPIKFQENTFKDLLSVLKTTSYGKENGINGNEDYDSFKNKIKITDYEGLRKYIDRIIDGEKDVLWTGRPVYFAKTSGTTSGVKYIPISKESAPTHVQNARNALFCYITEKNDGSVFDGKLIFLSGSPVLEKKGGILTGRLSGIVNHLIPKVFKSSQVPSWETNCIEDWETKVDAIVEETYNKDLSLISGIPPWMQMYFDRLLEKTGKKNIAEVFPNFKVLVYGGVNYIPYKAKIEESIGKNVDGFETYPASEGFIAYQDTQTEEGMLLLVNNGIFYEFIPVSEYFDENPTRISLKDVVIGVNYAIIMNTNAGLWGYSIGDTVKFVSTSPFRIVVTGRIKHFISAFGEHVIAEEVEKAMNEVATEANLKIIEFTVAPMVAPSSGLPYHEWLISFENDPEDLALFAANLEKSMLKQNIYYLDLREGNILKPLVVTPLQKDAFILYMKSQGKLGGQNKVPRLSNDRQLADELTKYKI